MSGLIRSDGNANGYTALHVNRAYESAEHDGFVGQVEVAPSKALKKRKNKVLPSFEDLRLSQNNENPVGFQEQTLKKICARNSVHEETMNDDEIERKFNEDGEDPNVKEDKRQVEMQPHGISRNRRKRKPEDEIEEQLEVQEMAKNPQIIKEEESLEELFASCLQFNHERFVADNVNAAPDIAIDLVIAGKEIPNYLIKSVTQLDLRNRDITLESFVRIMHLFKNLQLLKLPKHADDFWMKEISVSQQNLKNIDISGCREVTDTGLIFIGDRCKSISEINLSGCLGLTNEGIDYIRLELPELRRMKFNE